ncbi:MAG: dipeptidase, partial [Planctomycetaceae bacterium]|nr:dipeptidase [Planctomycetaceae bacterium]
MCRTGLCVVIWLLGTTHLRGEEPETRLVISEEAREIHQSGLLFDGHNDLPWQIWQIGNSSFETMDIAQPQPKLHTDIARVKAGGLKAQFCSVYVPAETDITGGALLKTLGQIDLVHKMVKKYPDVFEIARTADDVERIAKQGRVASMMGVEGGHCIENSLQNLKRFYDLGVRYMTLTHSRSLGWADSATGKAQNGGLSEFGKEVVREMNQIGMLVDLSHVSPKTMKDALEVSEAPVIFSHSSARAICDHPRNVPDDVLKLLPQNGGVVMINFYSGFIVPTEELKRDPKSRGNLDTVVDHIEHVIKVAGIDHVGIGSDFDGINSTPVGLEDVSTYPAITQELLNRGYNRKAILKILGGNVLRALRQAEKVAQRKDRKTD